MSGFDNFYNKFLHSGSTLHTFRVITSSLSSTTLRHAQSLRPVPAKVSTVCYNSQTMSVELRSGLETARLLKQDPGKYLSRVKGLYLLSLADCELGKVARASYFSLKSIDDALDGDRFDIDNPLRYALDVRSQVVSGEFVEGSWTSELAEYSIRGLERRAKSGDNPRNDFLASIDTMIFDYERSQDRRILSAEELDNYYLQTFTPVLNLMFIGLESRLRAVDVPELAYTQGRVYSVRDIVDDWSRGTINIPVEVLSAASLSSTSTLQEVQSSPVIIEWFSEQLFQSKKDIEGLDRKLNALGEWITIKTCDGLMRPMRKFIDRQLS